MSRILHSFLLGHIQYKPICNTAYMCGRFTHAAFKRRAIQGWGYDWAWKGNFTWGEDWTLKWIAPHCPTTDDFYYLLLSPNFI